MIVVMLRLLPLDLSGAVFVSQDGHFAPAVSIYAECEGSGSGLDSIGILEVFAYWDD
jgi:hypothetical protein